MTALGIYRNASRFAARRLENRARARDRSTMPLIGRVSSLPQGKVIVAVSPTPLRFATRHLARQMGGPVCDTHPVEQGVGPFGVAFTGTKPLRQFDMLLRRQERDQLIRL